MRGEGRMSYIDREETFKKLASILDFAKCIHPETIIKFIASIPKAEVVPERHATWIDTNTKFTRSNGESGNICKCSCCTELNPCELKTNYCPTCGAKMDLEE